MKGLMGEMWVRQCQAEGEGVNRGRGVGGWEGGSDPVRVRVESGECGSDSVKG